MLPLSLGNGPSSWGSAGSSSRGCGMVFLAQQPAQRRWGTGAPAKTFGVGAYENLPKKKSSANAKLDLQDDFI